MLKRIAPGLLAKRKMLLFLYKQEGIVCVPRERYSKKAVSNSISAGSKARFAYRDQKYQPCSLGDRIHLPDRKQPELGVIHEILDRKNHIIRRSVNLSKQTYIIAANIDQLSLLVTVTILATTYTFIDRFLLLPQLSNSRGPLFNKIDSYLNEEQQSLKKCRPLQSNWLRNPFYIGSEKEGIEDLKQAMNGKVSMFSATVAWVSPHWPMPYLGITIENG